MTPASELMKLWGIAEPTWHPCPNCGQQHSRPGLCWACDVANRPLTEDEQRRTQFDAIPPEYRLPLTAKALEPRRVEPKTVKRALSAVEDRNVVIVAKGSGKGKSSLAGAMARAYLEQGRGNMTWLPSFRISGDTWELPDEWTRPALVVLDDLGNERDLKSSLLQSLLEDRYASQKALWVTTFLDREEMSKKYGENNARRVYERATVVGL